MAKFEILYIEHDSERDDYKDAMESACTDNTEVYVTLITDPKELSKTLERSYFDLVITDAFFLKKDADHESTEDGKYFLGEIVDTIRNIENQRTKIGVISRISEYLLDKHYTDLDKVDYFWDKDIIDANGLRWWITRIIRESQKSFPSSALNEQILQLISDGVDEKGLVPWKESIKEIVDAYRIFERELDQMEKIYNPLSDIAADVGIGEQFDEIFEVFKASEPFNVAGNQTAWSHLGHPVQVFLLGYYILNCGMLDLKKIAQSIVRSVKNPSDKRASKIVNDTWFAAALFHDIGLLGDRLGDIVKKCNKLLSLYPSTKLRIKKDYKSSEIREELKEIYNEIHGCSGSSLGTWFGHHKDKTRDNIDHGLLSAATIIKRFKVKKDSQRISHAAFAVAIHNLAHSVDKKMPHIKFYDYPIAAMLLICDQLQVWGRDTGLENFTNELDVESIELNEIRYNKDEKKLYVLMNYYPYRYALASQNTMIELRKGLKKLYRKKILPTLERIEKDEKDRFKMDVRVLLNGRENIAKWNI